MESLIQRLRKYTAKVTSLNDINQWLTHLTNINNP